MEVMLEATGGGGTQEEGEIGGVGMLELFRNSELGLNTEKRTEKWKKRERASRKIKKGP